MSNDLTPPSSNTSVSQFLPKEEKEFEFDIDYARQNIQQLIETGIAGAAELAEIALSSQNAAAYERLGSYLKSMSELNKDLVHIAKIKKENKGDQELNQDNKSSVTNNLFVGSTAEMAAILADLQKKNNA